MKNNRTSIHIDQARTIGSLFLLAFVAYGFGRHLFESESHPEKYLGALLLITNSIMVFVIGILFRNTLLKFNAWVGNFYFFSRVVESIGLASLVLNAIPTVHVSDNYGYFPAMLALGLGSIPMCVTLYKKNLSPSWLAMWGTIGYTVFSFGFLMELFGREWSMYLLIPGGLWELTFATWLIVKGAALKNMVSITRHSRES